MKINHDVERVIQFRKEFRSSSIPGWYNGIAHVVFNFSALFLGLLFFLSKLHDLTLAELSVIPLTLIMGNFAVYVIHRFPLHKNYPVIGHHTYRIHSKLHHRFYTDQYSVVDELDDLYLLFFPPWTILLFLFVHCPMVYFLASEFISSNSVYLHLAMSTVYFILYEVFHFVSHLPRGHWILNIRHFARMREHHTLHHNPKYMHQYNFNVVFPLFDSIFKTNYIQINTQEREQEISAHEACKLESV